MYHTPQVSGLEKLILKDMKLQKKKISTKDNGLIPTSWHYLYRTILGCFLPSKSGIPPKNHLKIWDPTQMSPKDKGQKHAGPKHLQVMALETGLPMAGNANVKSINLSGVSEIPV